MSVWKRPDDPSLPDDDEEVYVRWKNGVRGSMTAKHVRRHPQDYEAWVLIPPFDLTPDPFAIDGPQQMDTLPDDHPPVYVEREDGEWRIASHTRRSADVAMGRKRWQTPESMLRRAGLTPEQVELAEGE